MSNFKLSMVPPLPPSSRHESLLNNKAIVVHLKGNQSYYQQRKVKMKSRKPNFKVIWDMLTKKWIVFKKNLQLCDLIEVAIHLEALGLPL
jgi:hypothetical protein